MNGCKCQQEFPGASGAHTELKTAYEPVPLLLWEQPGQNKRAIVFFWQPSYRNAIYHRPYSLLQKSQDSYFATQLVRTVGRILNKVWAQALPRRSTVQLQGTRHYPFSFLHWGFLSFLQVPLSSQYHSGQSAQRKSLQLQGSIYLIRSRWTFIYQEKKRWHPRA